MAESLRNPFPAVKNAAMLSYGGNQSWSKWKFMQRSGCGVISCANLLLYLHQYHCSRVFDQVPALEEENGILSLEAYNCFVEFLRKHYLPILPGFGLTGWEAALGLNYYFRRNHMKVRAIWGISHRKLWKRMETMLAADLPVVLAVGPNFPFFWETHKLNFYVKGRDGNYHPVSKTKAHFVTVTAMDEKWMRISSWGKEYYINRKEYWDYNRKYSSFLISNLVFLSVIT